MEERQSQKNPKPLTVSAGDTPQQSFTRGASQHVGDYFRKPNVNGGILLHRGASHSGYFYKTLFVNSRTPEGQLAQAV